MTVHRFLSLKAWSLLEEVNVKADGMHEEVDSAETLGGKSARQGFRVRDGVQDSVLDS